MNHIGLFEGIGGFSLAAHKIGWKTIAFCEIEKPLQNFLKHKFSDAEPHGDIRNTDFSIYREWCEILTGGFPCQNISSAGNSEGLHGKKSSLWFEFYRAIKEIHPEFVLIENSNQLPKKGLEVILLQLAECGYDAEWETFFASEYGHDHRRGRTYLLAYTPAHRRRGILQSVKEKRRKENERKFNETLDTPRNPFLRFTDSCGKPAIFGMDDGLPSRLDIVFRLAGCGNAIVPDIAFDIFEAIEVVESGLVSSSLAGA